MAIGESGEISTNVTEVVEVVFNQKHVNVIIHNLFMVEWIVFSQMVVETEGRTTQKHKLVTINLVQVRISGKSIKSQSNG